MLHFSTFGGNPLSSAAGLATIDYVVDNDLQGNAKAMGELFRAALDDLAAETPWIAEARGKGLMHALETVQPGSDEPAPDYAGRMLEACKAEGLLVGKGGLYGNVVRMTPMLDVTEAEMREGIDALRRAAASII